MSTPSRDAELLEEAERIHRALFRRPMPPLVGERYVAAHAFHCTGTEDSARIQRVLREGLDLEAVEYALRRRDPSITRKVQILLYVVETLPRYQDDLLNDRDRRLEGWTRLAAATFRSLWKLIKGRTVARRHGLL